MTSRVMSPGIKKTGRVSIFLLAFLFSFATAGHAWWNGKWQYRKKLTINSKAIKGLGNMNVQQIPVLVRLHSGNFNFANAKEDGSDLRFIGPDDKTLLKYHIEAYNPLDEIAFAWVNIPSIPSDKKQGFIWLYYGNQKATSIEDPQGTYDSNYALVYHLNEDSGPPQDKTRYKNNASATSTFETNPSSVIGCGITLNGIDQRITVPASSSLALSKGFSFSTWVNITGPQNDTYIFSREGPGGALIIGIKGTALYCYVKNGEMETQCKGEGAELSPNTWHDITVTAVPDKSLAIYVDGVEIAETSLSSSLPQLGSDLVIGGSLAGDHMFAGEMDEIRITVPGQTPGIISLAYASEGPDGGLFISGPEETGEETASSVPETLVYLSIIMKNISLDGWVIISALFIMGLGGLFIFAGKLVSFRKIEEGNKKFSTKFKDMENPLEPVEIGDELKDSTLYQIHSNTIEELKKRESLSSNEKCISGIIDKGSIAILNAAMERSFVEQSKKMNSWLVFLTICIAGAPSLGLLGTVWGVMNTFAAMAEAGEANIMAIAPGVASALATTVAGLLVAIPALFAYNYLAAKVKEMVSDMTVFIDEFQAILQKRVGEEK